MPILPARQLDVPMAGTCATQDDARHRRRDGDGRDHLHGARRERSPTLPRRIVRAVHAVPQGTGWMNKIVNRIERGAALRRISRSCSTSRQDGQTICAFADAAAWPVQGLLRHFADFELHVRGAAVPGLRN
jgi:hypothetical protein